MEMIARMLLFAGGLYVILLARTQLRTGHSVSPNASYHQTTFAASGFGVGLILMVLAFLPPKAWVYKHITTKKPKKLKPKFLRH